MSATAAETQDRLTEGYEALASGEWTAARDAFQNAVTVVDSAEALDGLGRALWWLREEREAVVYRERAYAGFRRDGELARAARIALWLSREYALVFGNEAAAGGWLARAERLLRDVAPGAEQGWLDLARSERTGDGQASAGLRARRSRSRLRRVTPISSYGLSRSSALPRPRSAGWTRASPSRRGHGRGNQRRADEPRDVRRRLLHPDARV